MARFAIGWLLVMTWSPPVQAANTIFTLTPTTNTWSTDTWSTAINTISAGDLAQLNNGATATTALDVDVLLGQLQTGSTAASVWSITGTSNTITLEGTGLLGSNQAFGNAGVAAIASLNAGGNLTIAPNIAFGTTALDIGATNTGIVSLSGSITATAAQTLNFRGTGSGTVTFSGSIGSTGSAITLNNLRGSGGSVVISGNLGANVAGVYQGSTSAAASGVTSTTSQLTLSGANASFVGGITLTVGQLNLNSVGAIGGATSFVVNGGTTLSAGVASITTAGNPTWSLGGNVTLTNNSFSTGSGAITLNGANVGFILNTTNNLTLGGNISGSASITKNAQSNGGFTNMGALILNGTNSYQGGTIIQQGQVQFGSAASVPATGSILLAGQGPNSISYEGAAVVFNFAFGNTELNKISSASVGTVALGAANSSALDFSSGTGANLSNVSLGTQGNFTYSGTLTPWTSSNNGGYLLGGSGNQSASANSVLTVSSNLGNVGSLATRLVVNPAFTGFGTGSVTLSGANTYTGVTSVLRGTLTLSGSLSSSTSLELSGGGTFAYAPTVAATAQTISGLTVGSGFNSVTTANAANTLNLGTLSRGTARGTVSFTPTGTINFASASNSNDVLGTWAVTGTGTSLQYAALNGSKNVVAYSGATAGTAADLSNLSSATTNYSLAGTAATLAASQTGNTLRYTAGAGTIALGTNSLTLNGLMHAGSGQLTISNTAGSAGIVVGASGVLDIIGNTQTIAISSVISGTGAVTYTGVGGGSLTLSGTNTFSGGFTLNSGTLNLANTTAGTANLGTGTLTLNGGQVNSNAVVSISNAIVFTQGTSTLINPNSNNLTFTGVITGSGTMVVGDGGSFASLNLSGDMSGFTGTMIYNAGGGSGDNLIVGNTSAASNNFSQATLIGLNAGSRRFNTNGGYLQIGALEGSMTIISGGTVQVGALNTNASFGGVTVTNNVAIVKVGTGTWTLNSAGGWGNSGGVTVNNGTLLVDMTGLAVPTNFIASSALTLNGGTLSVRGKATTYQNSSQAFSTTTFRAGSSSIVVDNGGSGYNTLVTLAAFTRQAGGTVNFTLPAGTQSSTNGITTTSTANTLGGIMTNSNTNSIAFATVGKTDWAAYSGNNIVALSSYTTGSFAGNTDVTSSFTATAAAANTSLRFNTDGVTLTLNGTNQVVTGGILTTAANVSGSLITGGTGLQTGGGNEFVFINYGKLTVESALINNGTTALTKSGAGLLVLANVSNTYSGITYLNEGTLRIAAAGSLGTNATATAISFNGGTLQLGASFNLASTQGINLGFNGGTWDTSGFDSSYAGAIASTSAVQGTNLENTAGQFGFTKAGAGVLTLTGTNTYAGATTVTGGTLSISYLDIATTAGNVTPVASGGIGKSASYAKNLVLNGGVLQYTGAATTTDRLFTLGDSGGGLDASGSGAVNFSNTGAVGYQTNSSGAATNSSPTLTLTGSNTGANTLAASIGNNGMGTTSLVKSGLGVWALTNANTYSGTTTVSNGTLLANNTSGSATGTGVVTVAAGAKLGGSGQVGSIASAASFTSDGTLFAGQAGVLDAQVLTVATSGTITLGGTVSLDIIGGGTSGGLNSQAGNNDKLVFTKSTTGGDGTPVITGMLLLNTSLSTTDSGAWAVGTSWDLVDWTGMTTAFTNLAATGTMMGNVTGLPDLSAIGYQWDWSNLYTTGVISVAAVPEPGRLLLLLGGLGALAGRRRRR